MTRLLQVTAHLQLRDPSAARVALEPILGLDRQHRTRPFMTRLADIVALADSVDMPTDPAVLRLRHDITAFGGGIGGGGGATLR
jgi:hypothetical protein